VPNHARVPFEWLAELFGAGCDYYWWLDSIQTEHDEHTAFSSTGWGGQSISVFPSLDIVVVITGGNYLQEDPGREIIEKYILPAVD
jgi:CubicO group peptidase (beta-lactamase class C family)